MCCELNHHPVFRSVPSQLVCPRLIHSKDFIVLLFHRSNFSHIPAPLGQFYRLRQTTYLHLRALHLGLFIGGLGLFIVGLGLFIVDLPLYARFQLSDRSVIKHNIHTLSPFPSSTGSSSCSQSIWRREGKNAPIAYVRITAYFSPHRHCTAPRSMSRPRGQ